MMNKLHESMDCKQVKALLRQYLFDELGAEEHGRVQGHLLECAACSQAFSKQVQACLRVGELPRVAIPRPPVPDDPVVPVIPPGQSGSRSGMPRVFRGLASAARELVSKSLAFSRPKAGETIRLDGGDFTVTLSQQGDGAQTLVRLVFKTEFAEANAGRRCIIRDAAAVNLLSGGIQDGELAATAEVQLATIQSPLLVKIFVRV